MKFAWLVLFLVACGTPEDFAEGSRSEGQSCHTLSDCSGDTVCLQYGDELGECTLTCTASVDECGASATCGPVSGVLDVCQPEEKAATAENPPEEEDTPQLTCETDEECAVLHPDAVCGTFMGAKGCTLQCNSSDVCNPPPIGGVSTSFMECGADEGADRDVCIPDVDCWNDPMGCVEIDGFPGF